jgi:predicted ATPase/tetratricopeptide (TPR) repeat protein
LDQYADGVWFIDFAPLSDPDQLAATLAQALGIPAASDRPIRAWVVGWLQQRRLLLLLDNCEQVIDGVATLVAEVLGSAPHVQILATSRIPLRIAAEQEYPVLPLELPNPQALPPFEQLSQYDAVALFIARARGIRPDFLITNANAPAVAEICVRLDGLPLALELAAARIRLFPPDHLLSRLISGRIQTLSGGARDLPPRQQTIRATIDWSYRLLTAPHQRLFMRLGVFVGGWTLDAAEAVCAEDSLDVWSELETLVEQSLVRVVETQTTHRFTMLETLREYALERLAEAGEATETQRRHAAYFVALAEAINAEGGEWEHADERTRTDYANLQAVLAWCRTAGPGGIPEADLGMRLAKALWLYWLNYDLHEGLRWLRELCGPAWRHGPPHLRARLLSSLGRHMVKSLFPDDRAQAVAVLDESVRLSREIGDMWALAEACRHRAQAAKITNDLAEAEVWLGESLAAGHAAGSPLNIAWTQIDFGLVAIVRGDNQEAARLFEACLPVFQRLGVAGGVSATVHIYSVVLLRLGAFARAAQLLDETLDSFRPDLPVFELSQLHDLRGQVAYAQSDLRLAWDLFVQALQFGREHAQQFLIVEDWVVLKALLGQLAVVAAALGHHVQATHLFCHAHDRLWYPQPNLVQAQISTSLAACRAALGEEAFEAAWAAGKALTLEQAVDAALAFTADYAQPPAPSV